MSQLYIISTVIFNNICSRWGSVLGPIFENRALSSARYYMSATSCKKITKISPIVSEKIAGKTDRTDGQTDRGQIIDLFFVPKDRSYKKYCDVLNKNKGWGAVEDW